MKGLILELIDEEKEVIDSVEADVSLPFLISNNILSYWNWAIHPTIMRYESMFCYLPLYTEGSTLTFPVTFELPEEFIEDVRSIRASLRLDDRFAEAGINTRISLNNSAHGYFKGEYKENESYFKAEADKGYPLAKVALESVNVSHILETPNLIVDEAIRRLEPLIANDNIDAEYQLARLLEANPDYKIQKRCFPYYLTGALRNPLAMIRLAEIFEQGFYDVQVDKKAANKFYAEGLRLLFMLTNHGHPNAAAALGRAALEGLGMEHYAYLAEQCYGIAKNAGYEDPELWLWENFGVALRRVAMPKHLKDALKFPGDDDIATLSNAEVEPIFYVQRKTFTEFAPDALSNPRTCLYLVRQKSHVIHAFWFDLMSTVLINRTVESFASQFYAKREDNLMKLNTSLVFSGLKRDKWTTVAGFKKLK